MANPAVKKQSNQQLFLEKFLKQFSLKFSKPTSDILSVRCVSKFQLIKQLVSIRDKLESPGHKRTSGKEILSHLEKSGLVRPIPTIDPTSSQLQNKFYLIGIESDMNSVSPIELLQAQEPKGVICYLTALEFHGLTTQIPSYHHIASLVSGSSSPQNKDFQKIPSGSLETARKYNPLGSKKFIFENIPYYITSRDKDLIPGIQERYLNEKTIFRITTFEQTLLDTLHRPLSCGGPSVIFEAWNSALDRIDSNLLHEYLNKINNAILSRRVGYMLQTIAFEVDGNLSIMLDSIKESIPRDDPNSAVTLLSGFDYPELNEEWFIKVP
ncbi:MAG: hypothetical protein BMS9Abin11_1405 [Gammaproteobacteria bacterium]|nr:MAG: hypothetical protein BMS9Abin11_1405 [Gammaproteobacteria bacterium]